MTAIQQEYAALHEQGISITEIARRFGKNKSSVSRTIQRAKRIKSTVSTQSQPRSARSVKRAVLTGICPYSDSCFTCPLEDCRVGANKDVNLLPVGFNYTKFMESCGRG